MGKIPPIVKKRRIYGSRHIHINTPMLITLQVSRLQLPYLGAGIEEPRVRIGALAGEEVEAGATGGLQQLGCREDVVVVNFDKPWRHKWRRQGRLYSPLLASFTPGGTQAAESLLHPIKVFLGLVQILKVHNLLPDPLPAF